MRKRDLLYVHALCALARREVEERRDPDDGTFAAYESMPVTPTAVHRPKSEHERAVMTLLDELNGAVDIGDDGRERTTFERSGTN